MRLVFLIALCLVTAYADQPQLKITDVKAPLLKANGVIIENEYIIVFNNDVTDENVQDHMKEFKAMLNQNNNKKYRVIFEYNIDTFRGYSAHMNEEMLEKVRQMKGVAYVEKNQEVNAYVPYSQPSIQQTCTLQTEGSWGLARTTSRDIPTRDDYSHHITGQGEGVYALVIDTGIEVNHPDFGGRALWGADFVDDPSPGTDLNGHGTHVAGTIMGTEFGIAKKAGAISVRVLNENGAGSLTGVLRGITYSGLVYDQILKPRGLKAVINLSLGAPRSTSINAAVTAVINKGIHCAIAAGNSNEDACDVSPASTPGGVTVAASDRTDRFASFSNWGTCVDIIAPGVAITSAWLNGGENTISGTSMAAPHVAGVMSKILSREGRDFTPQQMANHLSNLSTKGKITDIRGTTPNHLVFYECP